VLHPVAVGEIPQATAAIAWKVHPKGTDEMRVRDELGPLFADEDFAAEAFAGMYPERGQPEVSPALLRWSRCCSSCTGSRTGTR
jgi:hypothetical protein